MGLLSDRWPVFDTAYKFHVAEMPQPMQSNCRITAPKTPQSPQEYFLILHRRQGLAGSLATGLAESRATVSSRAPADDRRVPIARQGADERIWRSGARFRLPNAVVRRQLAPHAYRQPNERGVDIGAPEKHPGHRRSLPRSGRRHVHSVQSLAATTPRGRNKAPPGPAPCFQRTRKITRR